MEIFANLILDKILSLTPKERNELDGKIRNKDGTIFKKK